MGAGQVQLKRMLNVPVGTVVLNVRNVIVRVSEVVVVVLVTMALHRIFVLSLLTQYFRTDPVVRV